MEIIDRLAKEVDETPPLKEGAARMEKVPVREMHGSIALERKLNWLAPRLVADSKEDARPGYDTRKAQEFMEEPSVLKEKIKVLAELLRQSKACVAYTGAGISTGSGINDYATKAKNSQAKVNAPKLSSPLDAQPTLAHHVLGQLYHEGLLKHWIQQNHDGLPQKARFPQEALNEIHGAWFDPSNPVVPMSGSLRGDLFEWLQEWVRKADLCIAIGTSLSGMNADQIVVKTASRAQLNSKVLGSVIVGLQRTRCDQYAKLRFFAKIDTVMAMLAKELSLQIDMSMYKPIVPEKAIAGPDIFRVPYDKDGKLQKKGKGTLWNLSKDAKVMLTAGPGTGYKGVILGKNAAGHYRVRLPITREGHLMQGKGNQISLLGSWFVQSAVNGTIPMLPLINYEEE